MLAKPTWDKLANSAGRRPALVVQRLHPESRFNLFAAVDTPTGRRLLLLKSAVAVASALPAGRGFEVRSTVIPADPDGPNSLSLELTDSAYADVFDVVGNDIVRGVVNSPDESVAVCTFVSRIEKWQRFLDHLTTDRLTEPAQQGLFAELWCLLEVLFPETGLLRAVDAWAGPMKLAKDFQFPGLAFEVKASAAKQHTRFFISSEQQLGVRAGRLILCGVLLERVLAGGDSLPELVDRARVALNPEPQAKALFAQRLLEAGYLDSDASAYSLRFGLRSMNFFDVTDDFPRIVEADLRRGVGDVRYSILQSACETYQITEDATRMLLRSLP